MQISGTYNSQYQPSFSGFRMTTHAKGKLNKLANKLSPYRKTKLGWDLESAIEQFKKSDRDNLVVYVKDGKLTASYYMKIRGVWDCYASAVLKEPDKTHNTCTLTDYAKRFSRELRRYRDYVRFYLGDTNFKSEFL